MGGIEEFGNSKKEWFESFLELPNGIPSDDTFARVFARIKPEEFQSRFMRWVEGLGEQKKTEVINIVKEVIQ